MDFINAAANGWGSTYNLVYVNGHWLSAYPIVTPILLLPLYILHMLCMIVFQGSYEYYSVLSKYCASLMMVVASVLFYRVCEHLFNKRTAIITTIAFALGTFTWAISSQSLWQHGTSELLLVIALLCIVKNELKNSVSDFLIIGVSFGLYIFNRPPDLFMFIPILYYVWMHREHIYAFLFWACASAAPFAYYNIVSFGNLLGGYTSMGTSFVTEPISWIQVIKNILGFLISPNRGLFVFSPILILGIFGMYLVYKKRELPLWSFWMVSIGSMVLSLLFYSTHADSLLGGWTYGARYMICLLPFLVIFTGYAIHELWKYKWIITVLLVFSISIQAIGAWGYPYGQWNSSSDLHDRTRVWDTQDLIIVDSFWKGINKTESISIFIWPTLPRNIGYFVIWERGK